MENLSGTTLAIMLIDILLIGFGIYKWMRYKKLSDFGIRTEGTVIEMVASYNDGVIYFPKIRYFNLKNEQIIKQSTTGTNPPLYKVGDNVSIIYDGGDDEFIIDSIFSKFSGPAMVIIGSIIIAVYIYTIYYGPIPFNYFE